MDQSDLNHADDIQRILALCGVFAPILFTLIVVFLGWIQPEYSHVRDIISLLGGIGRPYAIVQNGNFVVCGSLVVAFAVGLHRGLVDGSVWGPGLLGFAGLGLAGAGAFPIALVETGGDVDWTATTTIVHQLFSIIFFLGSLASMFALSRRLSKDDRWNGYDSYSKRGGVVALGLVIVYSTTGSQGVGVLPDGLLQRIYIGWVGVWIEMLAIRLYRLS